MVITALSHASRLLAAFSVVPLIFQWADPASAADRLRLRYDLYVSNMRAIEVNQEIELAERAYSAAMSVRSKGMAGLFVRIETDLKATGKMVDGFPVPASFRIVQNGRRATVNWQDPNKPEAVREPELAPRKAGAVEAALTEPAADPLTALLHQGLAGEDKVCSGTERVYNGREVSEYRFERLDDQQFGDRDASVYRGPVIRCRLVYRLVAGYSDRAMAKNKAEPVIITFWVAPVKTAAAEKPLMLLIAFSGKYENRPFKGFLNAATISGRPLNPASLASR
jgi:Protein of unknown function (DUF3108)